MKKTQLQEKEINEIEENEACFQIIALAGDAKSRIKESMVHIREKEFSIAKKSMKIADENITKGRKIQHELLTRDVRGNNISISAVLLNHAMDILITAESELSMLDFIFQMIVNNHNGFERE